MTKSRKAWVLTLCCLLAAVPFIFYWGYQMGVRSVKTGSEPLALQTEQEQQAAMDLIDSFEVISFEKALADLEDQKTDELLFFGFRTCPDCQKAAAEIQKRAEADNLPVKHIITRDDNHELQYTDEQKARLKELVPDAITTKDGKDTLFVPCLIEIKDQKTMLLISSGH